MKKLVKTDEELYEDFKVWFIENHLHGHEFLFHQMKEFGGIKDRFETWKVSYRKYNIDN